MKAERDAIQDSWAESYLRGDGRWVIFLVANQFSKLRQETGY